MQINWEVILIAAFNAVGVLEYVKGIFKTAPSGVWRILQPALCLAFSALAMVAPAWIIHGITALSVSQIGYDVIIQTVKQKLKV
jgi:hypothetical protein